MTRLKSQPKKVAARSQAVAYNQAQAHPQHQKTYEEMVPINTDEPIRHVLTSMNKSHTMPTKATVRAQAVACNHAQARPTYLVHAKLMVKLAETCVFQLIANQLRSGFSYEDAIRIFIAYLNSFGSRTRINWVGLVEAARLIGVSPIELEAMAEAGEVQSMKVRRGYRFFAPHLMDWIVAQPVTPHNAELTTPGDPGLPREPRRNP